MGSLWLKMSIDTTNLLLGSGFAIFITLLAWGDQLRQPRTEIMQLEESFRKEFDLKKRVTNPIIRKSYDSMSQSGRYTFLQQTKSVVALLDNKKLKDGNIKLLERFRRLHGIRLMLEEKYRFRYFFTIFFCIYLFIAGIVSSFTADKLIHIRQFTIPIDYLLIGITLLIVAILIKNFIATYRKEDRFIEEINLMNDDIEAN